MDPIDVLKNVELFDGITPEELQTIAGICESRSFQAGDLITEQGKPGEELFIVHSGYVEIVRSPLTPDTKPRTIVNLGEGQIFGEMALVDMGPRSANVRALADNTRLLVIQRGAFRRLCDENHHLGYIVMQNIAADLSFKLRHRHLVAR